MTADPRDMSVVGHLGDVRTPDSGNDRNDTTVDSNMWLAPFTSGGRRRDLRLRKGGGSCGSAGLEFQQSDW